MWKTVTLSYFDFFVMSNEELVDKIVEKCTSKISVFLGAGASVPLGLPSMYSFWKDAYGDEFINSLDNSCTYTIAAPSQLTMGNSAINKTSALRRLIQTACLERKKVSFDLEIIYDYIHGNPMLAAGSKSVENQKKFFYFYHQTNKWTGNLHSNLDFARYLKEYGQFRNSFTTWIDDIHECIADLRRKVDKAYLVTREENAVDKAKKCFSFLSSLFTEKSPVIFTTNYDTIFEALEDSGKLREIGYALQSGCKQDQGRHFHFALENYLRDVDEVPFAYDGVADAIAELKATVGETRDLAAEVNAIVGETGNTVSMGEVADMREENYAPLFLFHLHGSVAWEEKDSGKIEDHFPKNHDNKSAIVEPVISKNLQKKEPFESLYKIFEKTLQINSILLVIGFSFRDDAIKKIVEARLNSKDFYVVCVAPQNENEPEMDRHLKDLEEKYKSKFIWLKEFFGTDNTKDLIVKTVNEILVR